MTVHAWRDGRWVDLTETMPARDALDLALGFTADARHEQVLDYLVEHPTAGQRVGAPHARNAPGAGHERSW